MESEDDKDSRGSGIVLLRRIWAELRKLSTLLLIKMTTEPSVALFDAINSESDKEVINTFLECTEILTTVKDPNGRNALHLLFLHRRYQIFITLVRNSKEQLLRAVDNEGNNVLHFAALFPNQFQSFSGLSPYIQMQRELKWFKVNSFISLFLFNHSLLLLYSKTSVPQIFTILFVDK